MMTRRQSIQGFTLLELMVVVAIIGILAAVGIPQYNQQMVKGKRSDGIQMLTRIMSSQERYFSNEVTYTADLTDLGYVSASAVGSSEGYYKVTASACAGSTIAQCVLLTATPQGSQEVDGKLSLNSRGAKTGNWP
jgi:type IV pilus assembly protein PilE